VPQPRGTESGRGQIQAPIHTANLADEIVVEKKAVGYPHRVSRIDTSYSVATPSSTSANALQYLQLDFQSHYDALIQRIQARYPTGWNDFASGNFGTIFLDIASWSLALQAYTINRLVAENFISTLQLRESAVRLGNLVNYPLSQPTPSTVLCAIQLLSPAPEPVVLAALTPVKTGSPSQTFEVYQDYTIPTGQLWPLIPVVSFNPSIPTGRNVVSLLQFTQGSSTAVCLDSTVNLQSYITPGQLVDPDDGTASTAVVQSIITDSNGNYDTLLLYSPWTGNTGAWTAQVYETRVTLIQGQTYTNTQIAPVNTAGMSLALTGSPVIDGSVTVTVGSNMWTQTQSLGLNGATDNVFQVLLLPSTESSIILFGDGVTGALVPSQANITITYRVGGGTSGNIASGAVDVTVTVVGTLTGGQYTAAMLNQQPASGGTDAETVQSARQNIPASISTGQRAVTRSDYETLAGQFSSSNGTVSFARAATRGGNNFLEGNLMLVYAWTTTAGGGLTPVTGPLQSDLQNYLQSVAMATDYVLLAEGSSQALPFSCQVLVAPGNNASNVAQAVKTAVDAYVNGLVPGLPTNFSQLIQTVLGVVGVANAIVATPQSDVYPANEDTVFIAPSGNIPYAPDLLSNTAGYVTGQLPFAPGFAWALSGTYGGLPVYIGPDVSAGFATISGTGLDPAQDSTINLATGEVQLYIIGPSQVLNIYISPVQAYTLQRPTDIYVSYVGDNSPAQRQQVRQALRAWSLGISVGTPLYATPPPAISAPPVSAYDVVNAIPGLTDIQVTLNSPSNPSSRLDVNETELVSIRNIYVNGLTT